MPVGRSWRPGPTVTHGVWWQQPGLLQPVPQSESIVHRENSFAVPVPQIFGPATTVCRYFPAIGWVGTMDSHVSVVVVELVLVLLDVDVDVLDDWDELVLDVVPGALVDVDVLDVVPGALVDVDVLDVVPGAHVVVVGAAVVVVVDARHGFFAIQGLCAQETAPREGSPLCLAQLSVVNCPHSGSPFSQKQQATLFVGFAAWAVAITGTNTTASSTLRTPRMTIPRSAFGMTASVGAGRARPRVSSPHDSRSRWSSPRHTACRRRGASIPSSGESAYQSISRPSHGRRPAARTVQRAAGGGQRGASELPAHPLAKVRLEG